MQASPFSDTAAVPDLATLPGSARLWAFAADRSLSPDEAADLLGAVRVFLDKWHSHGRPVPGAVEVRENRFLLVGAALDAEQLNAGVSGCGIDQMTHAVEAAADARRFGWAGALTVAYRDASGAVQIVPRPAFRKMARAGEVDGQTRVFDLTADTVGALRRHGLERPAAESWHGAAFRLTETKAT